MKLTAKARPGKDKGLNSQIRRKGNIPAVLYAAGKGGNSIEVDGIEFNAALRSIQKGHLSTTVFNINLDGKELKAIVKEIQYEVTTYRVIHLDFEELIEGYPITLRIPVECTGQAECQGIKLGGALRQVIRQVQVNCMPNNIPPYFELDIRELKMKEVKRLSDLVMPKGVKLIGTTDEVVALIAKR